MNSEKKITGAKTIQFRSPSCGFTIITFEHEQQLL